MIVVYIALITIVIGGIVVLIPPVKYYMHERRIQKEIKKGNYDKAFEMMQE